MININYIYRETERQIQYPQFDELEDYMISIEYNKLYERERNELIDKIGCYFHGERVTEFLKLNCILKLYGFKYCIKESSDNDNDNDNKKYWVISSQVYMD